jgi:hypothetical protein
VGSNQYKTRWGPDLPAPQREIGSPEDPPERRRCGEVWGTRCRAWVEPPTWSHGDHPTPGAREDRVRDPECPLWLLQQLAGDPSGRVRGWVASNPACPPALLQQLAQVPEPWVRGSVALNPQSPPGVLVALARDPIRGVRQGVASNRACPPQALELLARDPDQWVRGAALRHPNCPPRWRVLGQL